MARPTQLRVIGERPVLSDVEEGSPLAEAVAAHHAAENAARAGQYAGISGLMAGQAGPTEAIVRNQTVPTDDGARIIAYLQGQVAERDTALQTERSRAAKAESVVANVAAQAEEQITKAYEEATQAVRTSDAKRVAAESRIAKAEQQAQQKASFFATVSLGAIRQILDRVAWIIAFLTNKLPALGALYGGFMLWQSSLSQLSTMTLSALALYGALIVLPTVWLATRGEKPPPAEPQ